MTGTLSYFDTKGFYGAQGLPAPFAASPIIR